MPLKNWHLITPSEFVWEREALEFIRENLTGGDQFHAWSNFEFISDTGTIGEVDLLVLTPQGLFLIEIKSRPGIISGDSMTWTWKHQGRVYVDDNPLLSANRKAKKLASLLKKQKACKGIRFPYLEPLVFCSHPENQMQMQGVARYRVCLRDRAASADRPARKGIISALTKADYEGAHENSPSFINKPVIKAVTMALEQAGIKPSQRSRKVGDYVLGKLLYESPTGSYQDWEAIHSAIKATNRRVRIYNIARNADDAERNLIRRAAQREYQLLDSLSHPGILQVESFTEHELGPALIFRHDPNSIRLDHYLSQKAGHLNVDSGLNLLRQIAEAVKYAHEKKTIHRTLSPQGILVSEGDTSHPKIKIFNWQTGYRESSSTKGSTGLGATLHPEQFVEDISTTYLAPEAATSQENQGEHLDIFSLGAIAFHIFTGKPPAENRMDLLEKIREGKGLQISAVLDGAGKQLQDLIQFSTHPEVILRFDTVSDFLSQLDQVEDELTTPDAEAEIVQNPTAASTGDKLPGGFLVRARLGTGSSAVAFLVEKDGKEIVLKLANDVEHNDRLRVEAETVKELTHPNIVRAFDVVEIGGLAGYTMQKATNQRATTQDDAPAKKTEGTLAQRLRAVGPLHLELLERFGSDLLDAVKYLEREGVYHRDIKPDNIGIRPLGRKDELHLMLFDFSLCKAPLENIRAGTAPYLDPFLSRRKPPRWDLHAERFAVAMTLYEMATGTVPKWGDGQSSPEVLDCEATLHVELFDPNLREAMTTFFQKALRRDYRERFDNAEEMLRAWQRLFETAGQPVSNTSDDEDLDFETALRNATPSTQVVTLGLTTRAANVLDRINVITVQDLLQFQMRKLRRLPGVSSKTRQELTHWHSALRKRFQDAEDAVQVTNPSTGTSTTSEAPELEVASVDLIAQQVAGAAPRGNAKAERAILHAFIGWDAVGTQKAIAWTNQTETANRLGLTRARISQVVIKARERWQKNPSITSLRNTLAEFLEASSGVLTLSELCDAVLAARGSGEDEPKRSQLATVIIRAAVETESTMKAPRFIERRAGPTILITCNAAIADYVEKLGQVADNLARLDPLPTPTRVLEDLRDISAPQEMPQLTDTRLAKLAAAISSTAAISSKLEIYPVGMAAERALKLAAGALGVNDLTARDIQERVISRYPEAERLPDRPALDQLLIEAGLDLVWSPNAVKGKGGYQFRYENNGSGLSSSTSFLRQSTARGNQPLPDATLSPEIADARVFENKLRRAADEGAFLALTVAPGDLLNAEAELTRRFPVEVRNLDELLIGSMHEQGRAAGVDWNVVLRADAADSDSPEWRNLMILVGRSVPAVEKQLSEGLTPLPKIDGNAVPVISSSQWALIPEAWIANEHRSDNG